MKKSIPNKQVDFYFEKAKRWQEELGLLRTSILACGLCEELKWGVPCYTLEGSNIVLIHAFKQYCAVLFMKGVLLKDPKHMLVQQTKNVQAARQLRFTTSEEIRAAQSTLTSYINEAIELEKRGVSVSLKKTTEYTFPEELQHALYKNPLLKKAFTALTPGRQRGYLLYFSQAKQSKTREARIRTYTQHILQEKGLDDT